MNKTLQLLRILRAKNGVQRHSICLNEDGDLEVAVVLQGWRIPVVLDEDELEKSADELASMVVGLVEQVIDAVKGLVEEMD